MQTYDGATVTSGHLNDLDQAELPLWHAFFFHWAAHRLNLVLCQSALVVKEVKVFLLMSAYCTYSKPSPERKAHLNSYGIDIPNPDETK